MALVSAAWEWAAQKFPVTPGSVGSVVVSSYTGEGLAWNPVQS